MLETEPKDASKNSLWQNFVAIFEEMEDDKKVVIAFITCVKCSSVMSYDSDRGTWCFSLSPVLSLSSHYQIP